MTLRGGPLRSSASASTVPGWRVEDFFRFETNFLQQGVVSGLAVTQRGAGANMSVDVSSGLALISVTTTLLSPNATHKTWLSSDAVVNVAVPTADATNPRKDRIVAKFDMTADPNAAASNVVSITLVQGTPAVSPSAPATPSNAISLAIVNVAAGATSIVNANITDDRTFVLLDTTVLADVIRATNLASTASGKGASLVGLEDSGGNYSSTTVEAAFAEVLTKISTNVGLYGDGADGAVVWSSSTNLNPSTEKRYTTAQLDSGQTISVSSVNTPLVIHNTGSVTINGTVDLNGKGGAGGNGAAGGAGAAGTAGNSLVSGWTCGAGGAGGGGTTHGGGGGAASVFADGSAGANGSGGTGGTAGGRIDAAKLGFLSSLLRGVCCGGGGGGGGGAGGGTGGNGGAGGGALVWLIGGNLTLGASSIIRANGASGSNGTAGGGSAGGGGGGGGGTIIVLVAGSITNSGVTASASAGSAGSLAGTGGNGGAGAAGKVLIYSLSTGTLIAG